MNFFNEDTGYSSSWLRARMTAIRMLMDEMPTEREGKNSDRTFVRNCVIPEHLQKRFDEILDNEYKLTFALNEPLTFKELTSFNTWFVMHPEKVCGKEYTTSSREFPVMIKGTKEEIIRTIKAGIESSQPIVEKEPESVPDNEVQPENLQTSNPTQSQFQQDTQHLEPESEKSTNRFGNAKKALDWNVNDFNSFYHDGLEELMQAQAPVEKEIEDLKQRIKDAGKDRTKRKELHNKLTEALFKRNRAKNDYESDWLNFCMELRQIIIDIARQKGVHIDEENGWYIPDDILLAITERPGIEYYWNTPISEVIEKELQFFIKEQQKQDKGKANSTSMLELEAFALETELQLLTI